MDKKAFTKALKGLKDVSKKNFDQSYELIINLKNLDMKNQNNHIDMFVTLPKKPGKKISVCGLVGRELKDAAEASFDEVIINDDFVKFEGKKKDIKKLAMKHHYFVAQATLMPQVAKTFGRVFGPRSRMPNPKAGCVVPPNANLKPLSEKLHKTVRLMAKKMPVIQCVVGKESLSDEDVVENMFSVFNQVMHSLPQESNNIKSVFIKKTMSKAVVVGADSKTKGGAAVAESPKEAKPAVEVKAEKAEAKPKAAKKTPAKKAEGEKK